MKRQLDQTSIYELCSQIYPQKILGKLVFPNSESKLETYISKNRLPFVTPKLARQYQEFKTNLSQEIQLLDTVLGKKNYLIIKTLSSYPHTTSDLDVVVENKKIISRAVAQLNIYPQPLPIDINHYISWTYTQEISQKFIWNHTKTILFDDREILVPDESLDSLIRIGHIPFELAEIRLGELLHIFNALPKTDWSILRKEAKKNQWGHTFNRMEQILSNIHFYLYHQFLFERKKVSLINTVTFPYHLPYLHLLLAVIEKKAWKKMWGARYILRDRLQF